jgi:hypothetical protein
LQKEAEFRSLFIESADVGENHKLFMISSKKINIMIAKFPSRKGLSILAVILLNFLSPHAIAYDDHNDRSLSVVKNPCDSSGASESGNASGLSDAVGPSISIETSSAAQNDIDRENAPEGAMYSSSNNPLSLSHFKV